jgi:branched-chain amino acid transport system ATP-binding protein
MKHDKLIVQDLHYRSGSQDILRGVTFSVAEGAAVGIIGPNGSGKTTLFNALSGFVPTTRGSILLDGKELIGLAPHTRALSGLGRTFQNSGIFREMTVLENILTVLETRLPSYQLFIPWYRGRKEILREATSLLKEVSLDTYASKRAGDLSGGQLRLLEIARLRASTASLLLLDEPTAGVSPKMKKEVIIILQQLRTNGYTILIIEHDIHFIHSLCDRVLVLDSGRITLEGTPQEVRDNPLLHETYFGKTPTLPQDSPGDDGFQVATLRSTS